MLDAIPNSPEVYERQAHQEVLNRYVLEAEKSCLDSTCREGMSRAQKGIYMRGFVATIPERFLPAQQSRKGDEIFETRVVRHGTFTETIGMADYSEAYTRWIDGKGYPDINKPRSLEGIAWVPNQNGKDGIRNCIVVLNLGNAHNATEPLLAYDARRVSLLYPSNMTNAMMEAHESEHCLYAPKFPDKARVDDDYLQSVTETSADLSASIHYARKHGTFDIYEALIRPIRLENITDKQHTTAFALKVILDTLHPQVYLGIDPKDVPVIVDQLMKDNFEDEKGFLKQVGGPGSTTAMERMDEELGYRQRFRTLNNAYLAVFLGEGARAYGKQALMAIRANHDAFSYLAPAATMRLLGRSYDWFVTSHGLSDEAAEVSEAPSVQKCLADSRVESVLGKMMGM